MSQLRLPSLSVEYFNFDCCMPMNLSMLNVFSKLSFLQSPASSSYMLYNLVSYPYYVHTYSVHTESATYTYVVPSVSPWSLPTMADMQPTSYN